MAALVKAVPVVVVATMPIEKAISTAGASRGRRSTTPHAPPAARHLRRRGDARLGGSDGGYLLQASFSTGVVAAPGALAWLSADAQPHSSQTPVAGSVMEHIGRVADGASRTAVPRATGARAPGVLAEHARRRPDRDRGLGTSKPRLRRIATAPSLLLPNSSAVARRPVANRCATPTTALRS